MSDLETFASERGYILKETKSPYRGRIRFHFIGINKFIYDDDSYLTSKITSIHKNLELVSVTFMFEDDKAQITLEFDE